MSILVNGYGLTHVGEKESNMKRLLALSITLLMLSACGTKVYHRGQIFTEDQKAQLPKLKTKNQVIGTLGTPGAMNADRTKWMYLGTEQSQTAFFKPENDTYDFIVFNFKGDKVVDMNFYGEARKNDIAFSKKITPVPGEIQLNAFQELFMNIGRYSPLGSGDSGGPY